MAGSSMRLGKKRKYSTPKEERKSNPLKTRRLDSSDKEKESVEVEEADNLDHGESAQVVDEARPWRNLQLILSLRSKELDVEKKVGLAYDFFKALAVERWNDADEDYETVKSTRLIVFVSDWIQSLLISSGKKFKVEGDKEFDTCLSFKCWEIFRFCLERSSGLAVSLNLSRNLLRAISYIARSMLKAMPLPSDQTFFMDQDIEVFGSVLNCVEMMFSSKCSLSNENLDLWLSTSGATVELVCRVYEQNIEDSHAGGFVLKFSCLVLKPFCEFLRAHQTKKNGFRDFVDKLLQPLLLLLGQLHLQNNENEKSLCWRKSLARVLEETLSHGLFHSAHIDGFLSLRTTEKYSLSEDNKLKETKAVLQSYHRHLFDKLKSLVQGNKDLELSCMGDLLYLFSNRLIKHKRALVQSEDGEFVLITDSKHIEDDQSGSLGAETRKMIFDFFVQLMEPLLLKLQGYSEAGSDLSSSFPDVYCSLKSMNSLLGRLVRERVYVKTEDISGGACFGFLKDVYATIFSISAQLPKCKTNDGASKMIILLATELTIAVGRLLDIEYDIIDNDLVSLWLMIISYMGISLSSGNAEDQCLLTSQIIKLGCQLVKLYHELRQDLDNGKASPEVQSFHLIFCPKTSEWNDSTLSLKQVLTFFSSMVQVSNAIFGLCKAVKLITFDGNKIKKTSSAEQFPSSTSLHRETISKSVEMLFSSPDLRLAIHTAVKSIPEGQVSGCIRELTADLSETMKWIKLCCATAIGEKLGQPKMDDVGLQAELMGRALSEIYSLVLESLTVTAGNSNPAGDSMVDLMNVIRPLLSNLVFSQPDCVNKFLFSVTGTDITDLTENTSGTHWFALFFLRLYMSCRSLYRQVISLVPLRKSKIANIMPNSFTSFCGNDLMKRTERIDDGYFSWIMQPSASVLEIIACISEIYLGDNNVDCSPLIYLLHTMALQRLVDLNRHIKSLEYLSLTSDITDLSTTRKRRKNLKKQLSVLKQEAEDLTNFMTRYLSLLVEDQDPAAVISDFGWDDFCVSAINKNVLPSALWWVICKNIDIWCTHAAKKKLKKFLSVLVSTSISCYSSGTNSSDLTGRQVNAETSQKKGLTVHQISIELLSDSVLYEHEFVRGYLASSFCKVLENTALQTFKYFPEEEVNFNSAPDWIDVSTRLENLNCDSLAEQPRETCKKDDDLQLDIMKFTDCQSLLNLLGWMPKEYLKAKSLKLFATYILNLERLLLFSLVRSWHRLSVNDQQNLSSLLVSCRRTLKNIIMVFCNKTGESLAPQLLPAVSDASSLALWLSKSVYAVIGLQGLLIVDSARKARDVMIPLMDHTFYIFLTISRSQFSSAIPLFVDPEKLSKEGLASNFQQERNGWNESDQAFDMSRSSEDCRRLLLFADTLKEQAEILLNPLKDALHDGGNGFEHKILAFNKLSSTAAFFGGFLWGLASTVKQLKMLNIAKLKWKCEAITKLASCINALSEFVGVFIELLFLDQDGEDSDHYSNTDSVQTQCLKKVFLQDLLRGDLAQAAFALRQLLIAFSAILRLNLHINGIILSPRLVSVAVGIAQILLSGLADTSGAPDNFTFVWLDGAIKFMEELGSHFRSNSPILSSDLYSKLIELQLRVLGKCISLQGKEATLDSHETTSFKQINVKSVFSEDCPFQGWCWLDEFKGRLRVSFKEYVDKSSEQQLLSVMQAVERSLVGVWEVCPNVYKIQTGSADGGEVSSTVAAGIDCLDLVLEHASGRKHLNLVKKHIHSLITGLFSAVVHLQNPSIFCTKSSSSKVHNYPDPGSVILMSVEVLTRVSGKHALFAMDQWQISQSVRIPGSIFQNLLQLQVNGAKVNNQSVDREFSISLYAACCRLLYTVVKHHKSDAEGCIAVLQESVSVLLHCLERVGDESTAPKGYFSWTVQEGVKCACFLRRIYEELRQQKDIFSQHCFKFLSSYIWVYTGHSLFKTGIRRDVDEALRPGIYALIDACSPTDLQYLHTVSGEGPLRNTLATLQHDYKLNFKYEGKV